jgi:hypothetical protein
VGSYARDQIFIHARIGDAQVEGQKLYMGEWVALSAVMMPATGGKIDRTGSVVPESPTPLKVSAEVLALRLVECDSAL